MSDIESLPESPAPDREDAANVSDDDLLSEIDEDQFEDYDPETANIEDRPVAVDEDVAKTLKASKRKIADGAKAKRPKEGRREKRSRDDEVSGDMDIDSRGPARKSRRQADAGERKPRPSKPAEPEIDDESHLSPEERRRRAIDRALDAAMKGPVKRKKKKDEIVGGIALFAVLGVLANGGQCRTSRTKSMRRLPISRLPWRRLAKLTTRRARLASQPFTS